MGHLLMLESWVGGTGQILPAALAAQGHTYTFVTRQRAHYAVPPATHPVLAHAAHLLTIDTNDLPTLIAFLRHQHAVLQFDGVLTICDYYIDTARAVADALDLPCPFPPTVSTIRNKGLMRAALATAGLPNPAYRLVTSWDEARQAAQEIGYPLVIKPTDLASSAHVRLIRTEAELQAGYAVLDGFPRNFRDQPRDQVVLLEAYMAGPEVSVEACAFQGETTIIGITDKGVTAEPYFIEDSHMFPAALDAAERRAITDLVGQALRRRFIFVEMQPQPEQVQSIGDLDLGGVLRRLNQRIAAILDRDHQIGHSYFMGVSDLEELRYVWYNRVIPLLQEYFYNDGERLAAVLGVAFVSKQPIDRTLFERGSAVIDLDRQTWSINRFENDDAGFSHALRSLAASGSD
ncbi:MAG: ATP-grasp domain-containing protein [Herpetosiphonaceae bacterium]|nr:ATP-grasp domain-containing protein [Herpetosiphonaceae bacterium]